MFFFGFQIIKLLNLRGVTLEIPSKIALKKSRAMAAMLTTLSTSAILTKLQPAMMMIEVASFSRKVFPHPKQKHQLLSNLRNHYSESKTHNQLPSISLPSIYFLLKYTYFPSPPFKFSQKKNITKNVVSPRFVIPFMVQKSQTRCK